MESKNCQVCISKLEQATSAGFVLHFHFLQNGSLYLPICREQYDVEQVSVTIQSCVDCGHTQYFINTHNGYKGIALEAWDILIP